MFEMSDGHDGREGLQSGMRPETASSGGRGPGGPVGPGVPVGAVPGGSSRPSAFSSRTEIAEQDRVFFSQAMNF